MPELLFQRPHDQFLTYRGINAAAESFWATLKRELVSRIRFETRSDARRAITAWIHHYNTVRLHSSIGNVPPIEWELRFACRQLQAA